ncbi:hypothetical protein IJM86_01160 [bacterium]|nr:hypothetical protein [bacterium]
MPKFEETLKEINNWECSSSASGLVSEIKILSGNFYTADWEHENNFLS